MVRKLPPLPTFPSVFGAEIRLIRRGCSNRRFFQIGVATAARRPELAANEVIGAYDPMVNENGEKLVSLDLHRFAFWLGQGAKVTAPLRDLLGKHFLFSLGLRFFARYFLFRSRFISCIFTVPSPSSSSLMYNVFINVARFLLYT